MGGILTDLLLLLRYIVARCSRQLTGPADWVLSHWDVYAVLRLEAVAMKFDRH